MNRRSFLAGLAAIPLAPAALAFYFPELPVSPREAAELRKHRLPHPTGRPGPILRDAPELQAAFDRWKNLPGVLRSVDPQQRLLGFCGPDPRSLAVWTPLTLVKSGVVPGFHEWWQALPRLMA